MEGAIDLVFKDNPAAYQSYAELFGLNIKLVGIELTNFHMLSSLVVFMLIFLVLGMFKLSKIKL